jgi:hypothetical protein
MEPKLKMGLIAGGIVGTILLAVGGVALVASLAGSSSSTSGSSQAPEEDAILNHPFWRKKPQAAQLYRWLDLMMDPGNRDMLVFDDQGACIPFVLHGKLPSHVSARRIYMDTDNSGHCPSKTESLRKLREHLDDFMKEEKYNQKIGKR